MFGKNVAKKWKMLVNNIIISKFVYLSGLFWHRLHFFRNAVSSKLFVFNCSFFHRIHFRQMNIIIRTTRESIVWPRVFPLITKFHVNVLLMILLWKCDRKTMFEHFIYDTRTCTSNRVTYNVYGAIGNVGQLFARIMCPNQTCVKSIVSAYVILFWL